MPKMNSMTLIAAIVCIADLTGKEVTAIQFEDGSGHNFNYQIAGSNWFFINLDKTDAEVDARIKQNHG